MSRVDEKQAQQAKDAERMNQQADRAARDSKTSQASRERFGQMLKGSQSADKQQQTTQGRLAQAQGQGKHVEQKVNQEGTQQARTALLARGGAVQNQRLMEQAKSFDGTLAQQRVNTQKDSQERVESRQQDMSSNRSVTADKQNDLELRNDQRIARKEDDTKADAHLSAKAANSKQNHGCNDATDKDQNAAGAASATAGAAAPKPQLQPAQVQQAQQARPVQKIPEAILEKLAAAVRLGVNAQGLTEFQVDLKEGVLAGASMKVTAKDGKVSLTFLGLDTQNRNLVESSKGELMRKLGSKGLTLDRLNV